MTRRLPRIPGTIALLLLLIFFSTSAASEYTIPGKGPDVKAFVPAGFLIMEQAKGDLNKDGIPDVVLVLKNKAEDRKNMDTEEIHRLLAIIFGVQGGGYTLSASSKEAILCKTCGGVYGDPFASVKIVRGTVVIDHYGGSRQRWGFTHRWRFQEGGWFLIGLTSRTEDTGNGASEVTDTNLVTGDRTVEKKPPSGKTRATRSKVPVKPLKALSDFSFVY